MSMSSYMVDAADHEKLEASKTELHSLLEKPQLAGIPILVLGNKKDLPTAMDEKELIDRMYYDILLQCVCLSVCLLSVCLLCLSVVSVCLSVKSLYFIHMNYYKL